MARRYVDGVILLDDPTILAGLRFMLERGKQLLEPAGAAALAAVLAGRIPIEDGERVAVILSGGNVEVGRLGRAARRRRDVARGRRVTEGPRRREPDAPAARRRRAASPDDAARPPPRASCGAGPSRARRPSAAPATDPPAPSRPIPPSPPAPPLESTRRLVGASFDLLSRASDEMRAASFYVGAIVLGTVGPFALASWVLEVSTLHRTVDQTGTLMAGGAGAWYGLLAIPALIGGFVALVESRTMAAGDPGRAAGRPAADRPPGPRPVADGVLAGRRRLDRRGRAAGPRSRAPSRPCSPTSST